MSGGFNMIGWAHGLRGYPIIVRLRRCEGTIGFGQFMAIQLAAKAALDHPELALRTRAKYQRRLQKLVAALQHAGFRAKMPSGTYFLYVKAPKACATRKFANAEEASTFLIEEQSVCCVPWDDGGPFLRFSATYLARDGAEEDALMRETAERPRQTLFAIRSLEARERSRHVAERGRRSLSISEDRAGIHGAPSDIHHDRLVFRHPSFFMSGVAVTLVIWRLLLNNNAKTNMNEFLPRFQEELEKKGIDAALRFCRSQTGMIPRKLYVAGLETSKQGLAAMRRAMANVIELEILPDLNFLLPMILAIAKIATMVGLLGTVVSMIGTFNKIQEGGDAKGQSAAIGLALFATALGLVTAIPLVFTHVLFKAWIGTFETKMKSAAQKLLILIRNAKA